MTSRTSRVIWNAPAGDKTLPSASDALLTAANADACERLIGIARELDPVGELDQPLLKFPSVLGAAQLVEIRPTGLDKLVVLLADLIPVNAGGRKIAVEFD